LRFLIELSITACFVSQQYSKLTFEDQIKEYEKLLKSTNISIINDVNLYFLSSNSDLRNDFISETKRLYGKMSNYVHLTPHQVAERLELAQRGRYIGFEGVAELNELNFEIS